MRPRKTNRDLPPRMVRRSWTTRRGAFEAYYYEHPRDESGKRRLTALGKDLNEAKRKWAELERQKPPVETGLLSGIFDRYEREVVPTQAPRTQKDRLDHLKKLRPVFGQMHIDEIRTSHLQRYLDLRTAKVRANREISTFSAVFNRARAWGYTDKSNPCSGLIKNPETGRDIYVSDEEYALVYEFAPDVVKDALDLAYLTGQRPADVRAMRWEDVRDGSLWVRQGKTKAKLRIVVEGELEELLKRIKARGVLGLTILADPKGQPLKEFGYFRSQFAKARDMAEKAAKERGVAFTRFQFRDLRPKAASDLESMSHARRLLGHKTETMTSHYVRERVGEVVRPVGKKADKA